MPDRPDKKQRKEALKEWQAQQRSTARHKLPLTEEWMKQLFDMLSQELPKQGCDHTMRILQGWCFEHQLPFDAIAIWCRENASNCDCEVLANCEHCWLDAIR